MNINKAREILYNSNYDSTINTIVSDDSIAKKDEEDNEIDILRLVVEVHERTHYYQHISTSYGLAKEILRSQQITRFLQEFTGYLKSYETIIRRLVHIKNPHYKEFKTSHQVLKSTYAAQIALNTTEIDSETAELYEKIGILPFRYDSPSGKKILSLGFDYPLELHAVKTHEKYLKSLTNNYSEYFLKLIDSAQNRSFEEELLITMYYELIINNVNVSSEEEILKIIDWSLLFTFDIDLIIKDTFSLKIPLEIASKSPMSTIGPLLNLIRDKNNSKMPEDLDDFRLSYFPDEKVSRDAIKQGLNFIEKEPEHLINSFKDRFQYALNLRLEGSDVFYNLISESPDRLFRNELDNDCLNVNRMSYQSRYFSHSNKLDLYYFYFNEVYDCLYLGMKRKCPFWISCNEREPICETDYFMCNNTKCTSSMVYDEIFGFKLDKVHDLIIE